MNLLLLCLLTVSQDESAYDRLFNEVQQGIEEFISPSGPASLGTPAHWAQLQEVVDQVLNFKPSREVEAQALFIMGMRSLVAGNPDAAISDFSRGLTLNPNQAALFRYGMGLTHTLDRRYDLAEEQFLQAVDLWTEWARPWMTLGAIYLDTGRLDPADSAVRKGLDLTLNDRAKARGYLLLAQVQKARGDARGALANLRLGAEADPDDPSIAEYFGMGLFASGDRAGALKVWNAGRGLFPNHLPLRLYADALEKGVTAKAVQPLRLPSKRSIPEGETHVSFSWSGRANDVLKLRVESPRFSPIVIVTDRSGRVSAIQDIQSSYFGLLHWTVPATGSFQVHVFAGSSGTFGEFEMAEAK